MGLCCPRSREVIEKGEDMSNGILGVLEPFCTITEAYLYLGNKGKYIWSRLYSLFDYFGAIYCLLYCL
jgi:hypothetical protein